MPAPHWNRSSKYQATKFRDWLVQRVAETAWAWGVKGATNQELCAQLGIEPSVLVDARRYMDALDRSRNKVQGTQRVRTSGRNTVQVVDRNYLGCVLLPQYLYLEWRKLLDLRGINEVTLLRSALHHFLTHPGYPLPRDHWTYQGKRYVVGETAGNPWIYRLRFEVPAGFMAMVHRRRRVLGVPLSRITRNLVLDILEGRLLDMRMITASQQLWESSRYQVGDEAVRTEADRVYKQRRKEKQT
jgi:hypothetical protein